MSAWEATITHTVRLKLRFCGTTFLETAVFCHVLLYSTGICLVNSAALGYCNVASYVKTEGSFANRLKRVRVLKEWSTIKCRKLHMYTCANVGTYTVHSILP